MMTEIQGLKLRLMGLFNLSEEALDIIGIEIQMMQTLKVVFDGLPLSALGLCWTS